MGLRARPRAYWCTNRAGPLVHRGDRPGPPACFNVKMVATCPQSCYEGSLIPVSDQVEVGLPGEARLEHPVGVQLVVVSLVC